jgi:hypothetical protein
MQVEKLIENMVGNGAALWLASQPGLWFPVGYVRVVPGALEWCSPEPVDQHHVHRLRITGLEPQYDRDVIIKQGDAVLGYLCPIEESGMDDEEAAQAILATRRWRQAIEGPAARRRFLSFMDAALA